MLTLLEFEKTKKLMIAAHRGSSESSTENTLAAFSEAIEAGIHIIELDIHFTLDNQSGDIIFRYYFRALFCNTQHHLSSSFLRYANALSNDKHIFDSGVLSKVAGQVE